jgi:hypothetical protein
MNGFFDRTRIFFTDEAVFLPTTVYGPSRPQAVLLVEIHLATPKYFYFFEALKFEFIEVSNIRLQVARELKVFSEYFASFISLSSPRFESQPLHPSCSPFSSVASLVGGNGGEEIGFLLCIIVVGIG